MSARWRLVRTSICDLLGCDLPILQAGMGGVARYELAAAVCEAGAFGMLGMVREHPERIVREIEAVRARTERPFAVNLIPAATDAALLDAELGACLEADVPAVCLFWDVYPEVILRAKEGGCIVLHQVGSPEAAHEAEKSGVDVLIAQGVEAGGHVHRRTGALVLVEEIARMASVPVIASGGFATGASLVAALALGAQGIHSGTAFLATHESFAHPYHKELVVAADAASTVHTDVYGINWPPNSPVRVIGNLVTDSLGHRLLGHDPDALPREVIALDEGRRILRFSTDSPLRTTQGNLAAMALFAGQSVSFIDRLQSAAEVVERIALEAEDSMCRLQEADQE